MSSVPQEAGIIVGKQMLYMQSIQSKLAKVLSKKTKAISGCREGTGYWLKQMNTLL